jgi:hypothetical protein
MEIDFSTQTKNNPSLALGEDTKSSLNRKFDKPCRKALEALMSDVYGTLHFMDIEETRANWSHFDSIYMTSQAQQIKIEVEWGQNWDGPNPYPFVHVLKKKIDNGKWDLFFRFNKSFTHAWSCTYEQAIKSELYYMSSKSSVGMANTKNEPVYKIPQQEVRHYKKIDNKWEII